MKDVKGRECCIMFRYCSSICLEGLRKTAKTLSQDIQSPGRYLTPDPPEYEAEVLTT
jgi:hypothetical protein